VYEGYKSDCPDFQGTPVGDLWVVPFDQVVQRMADNAQHNIRMLRTDPGCMDSCLAAAAIPIALTTVCSGLQVVRGVPSPYIAALQAFCAIFRFSTGPAFAGSATAGGVLGPYWCENRFCLPPSGRAKE
jgi:hypothetical protein